MIPNDWRAQICGAVERKEISRSELARRSGISQPSVSLIVSGRAVEVKYSTVAALWHALKKHQTERSKASSKARRGLVKASAGRTVRKGAGR